MSKLVIVESPAKAKTIGRFLGSEYRVEASFGHVRDLPERADEIPADLKKKKWARYGVNFEEGFEPIYVVPADKKRHVDNLKKASKEADELLLATDEDREGESISWHILQLLKPKKSLKVRRIVFHEITPEAIAEALRHPRDLDDDLVKAQEARRVVDRLYGYALSPLLWKKVAPRLSAGRVQSVAVRLAVERERLRRAFVSAEYWDLGAQLRADGGDFKARLVRLDGRRIATGKSFDPNTGRNRGDDLAIDGARAAELREAAQGASPWKVASVETQPGVENPPPPFMTSTLQQEASRKLRFNSKRTMQIAQQLYEGIDLGTSERVGLITYMRTDSLTLAERAQRQAREVVAELYGPEYLPAKPPVYRTKAKNAQEAHEAIRPTDLHRRPAEVARFLDRDQLELYDLIWKRTIASQMLPARVQRTTVDVVVATAEGNMAFHASGKTYDFMGFLMAYREGDDQLVDTDAPEDVVLPPLREGDVLDLLALDALEHHTKPPARYTEASLIKKLEEEGIGRPSTYASILGTIQDRGYIVKRASELVPTFTAFAVTELLEGHFKDLVDLKFTARMEDELDDIAEGKADYERYLGDFYLGDSGLERQIERQTPNIGFPSLHVGDDPSGKPIVVRIGRFGPFLQRGDDKKDTAPIPDDLAPADLTIERALELFERKANGPEALAVDPATGRCVFHRKGRFGDYLEVEPADGETPRRVTIPGALKPGDLTEEVVVGLLKFPQTVGQHPQTGDDVVVAMGRYGAYLKCGAETRNVEDWRKALALTLAEALAILAAPKPSRRARTPAPSREPIKTFEGIKVLDGRYGPYVTDGKTNATIPKSMAPSEITEDQARALITARASAPASPKRRKVTFRRKSA